MMPWATSTARSRGDASTIRQPPLSTSGASVYRTSTIEPTKPATVYVLMTGEWPTVRLPGWVALSVDGQAEAEAWAQHRDALIAEAARYDFKPYWLDERAPSGPGFERWRATFVARHSY